ncbi:calcium-activated chloride channel-domain-containing protein [Spinellus fusiger]|nr:calcium-activated chloride channel-domain-containing protein [Spinellus fusiger]
MTHQEIDSKEPGPFPIIAPPWIQTRTATSSTTKDAYTSSQQDMTLADVDLVIVFKFPTHSHLISKQQLEIQVTRALENISCQLKKVGLLFHIKPGKDTGVLLVMVGCPLLLLETLVKRERMRDFLLGVRAEDIDMSQVTKAERQRLIYDLITMPSTEGGANISSLTDEYVDSIMPLHDEAFNKTWIHAWSKKWRIDDQNINSIRDQFGEKIAYYFAFVQNYLVWLSVPSVLGIFTYFTHDNTLALGYSFAMILWSLLFIEMWKRKEKTLAIAWGTRGCSKHDKRRADYGGDGTVFDEVTGEETPFVKPWKLIVRRALAIPGVTLGAVLLSAIVGVVFLIQLFLHEYYTGPFGFVLHYAPTLGYVLLIPTMSTLYTKWVRLLNNWEMHKTEASWEQSYTQKIFIANFLVGYLSLFITAWIYIPFGDHVLPYLSEYNISHEHKKVDFVRLKAQLVYFVVSGQIVGFVTEMVVPFAMRRLMPKANKLKEKIIHSKHEDDSMDALNLSMEEKEKSFMESVYKQVEKEEYNLYTDYVEMVIQFGYVSMFSTVWPLTALCCSINNWVELRGDALKICKYTRCPIPARAEGSDPWIGNMETLVWLSSITMASFAYLFHPSTDIHSPYTPIMTLLAVMVSEHLYVFLCFCIQTAVHTFPYPADTKLKREEYKLKKKWLDQWSQTTLPQQTLSSLQGQDMPITHINTNITTLQNEQTEQGICWIQSIFKNH